MLTKTFFCIMCLICLYLGIQIISIRKETKILKEKLRLEDVAPKPLVETRDFQCKK